MTGSLALLLHAHLPFVRHPQPVDEERWLFEAITECYVPLVRTLRRLSDEGISAPFAVSVSPTLVAMLNDELLRARYVGYLAERIELAVSCSERSERGETFGRLAEFHREFFGAVQQTFVAEWQCDLVAQFRTLSDRGAIELIASAATHALLSLDSRTARTQIAIGIQSFRETFGCEPAGFWLPECAYSPGLEKLLAEHNIRWFGLEAHAFERASPRARRGPFASLFTPSGPAAFAREPRASRQIWDARQGYPGDRSYRDFHSDLGFEMTGLPVRERKKFTGLKFRSVTGRDAEKHFYDPAAAAETARRHARHFVDQQIAQIRRIETAGSETIIFAPFDAELFGHWWFEGPIFLEALAREAAHRGLSLTTPTKFLERNPTQQIAQPAVSSWGDGGFLDVWLDEKCAWLHPPLQVAQKKMGELAARFDRGASEDEEKTLSELARELLLAQASDWPFLIRNGVAGDYAARRVREHLGRFYQLARALENGEATATIYPSLFPKMNWRTFLPS